MYKVYRFFAYEHKFWIGFQSALLVNIVLKLIIGNVEISEAAFFGSLIIIVMGLEFYAMKVEGEEE
jgi:hypothetical protein